MSRFRCFWCKQLIDMMDSKSWALRRSGHTACLQRGKSFPACSERPYMCLASLLHHRLRNRRWLAGTGERRSCICDSAQGNCNCGRKGRKPQQSCHKATTRCPARNAHDMCLRYRMTVRNHWSKLLASNSSELPWFSGKSSAPGSEAARDKWLVQKHVRFLRKKSAPRAAQRARHTCLGLQV